MTTRFLELCVRDDEKCWVIAHKSSIGVVREGADLQRTCDWLNVSSLELGIRREFVEFLTLPDPYRGTQLVTPHRLERLAETWRRPALLSISDFGRD